MKDLEHLFENNERWAEAIKEEEAKEAYHLMAALRAKKIACEIYPDKSKFDKQFKYAEKKGIPNIIIIGSDELNKKECTLKNLITGTQQTIPFDAETGK